MQERGRLRDLVSVALGRARDVDHEGFVIRGFVVAELRGPDGELKSYCETHNLVTQVGDQYYAERAVTGISGSPVTGAPAQVTGMELGTGSTTPAKTGAGAALVTFLTGSKVALTTGYPTSALNSSSRRITWQTVWGAGVATSASTPITEVVLVNETLTGGSGASSANTISRALLTGIGSKGASDTLTVTWNHDLLGAP